MNILILATAITISWTAPLQRVDNYNGQRSWDHGAHWETMRLWSDSALTVPYTPGQPGTLQRCYIWNDAPNRNDLLGRLVACNDVGCSPVSNEFILSTGLKDTTQFLWRGVGVYTQPRMPKGGTADWMLAPDDSASWLIYSQTQVQAAEKNTICAIFGTWCVGGTCFVCP